MITIISKNSTKQIAHLKTVEDFCKGKFKNISLVYKNSEYNIDYQGTMTIKKQLGCNTTILNLKEYSINIQPFNNVGNLIVSKRIWYVPVYKSYHCPIFTILFQSHFTMKQFKAEKIYFNNDMLNIKNIPVEIVNETDRAQVDVQIEFHKNKIYLIRLNIKFKNTNNLSTINIINY